MLENWIDLLCTEFPSLTPAAAMEQPPGLALRVIQLRRARRAVHLFDHAPDQMTPADVQMFADLKRVWEETYPDD